MLKELNEKEVFEELGEEGFTRLVAGFYKRVKEDDIIGPMYPDDDWEGSEKRLRDFLIFRFGGSSRYIQERGHPRLRGRHAPFKLNEAASIRWVELMQQSMDEMDLTEKTYPQLLGFFSHVAQFLRNHP